MQKLAVQDFIQVSQHKWLFRLDFGIVLAFVLISRNTNQNDKVT